MKPKRKIVYLVVWDKKIYYLRNKECTPIFNRTKTFFRRKRAFKFIKNLSDVEIRMCFRRNSKKIL